MIIGHLTAEADHAIHMIHTKNITETNVLIYATAKVITRHTSTKKIVRTNTQISTPPWRRRLENKINNLRKDISRMESAREVHNTGNDNEAVQQERMSEISNRKCKAEADSYISHRLQRYTAKNITIRQIECSTHSPEEITPTSETTITRKKQKSQTNKKHIDSETTYKEHQKSTTQQGCQMLDRKYGKCLSNLWQKFWKMAIYLAILIFHYKMTIFWQYILIS